MSRGLGDVYKRQFQSFKTQLVGGIGGIGNQLSQKDFLVAVKGMDHQLEQLTNFSLKAERFSTSFLAHGTLLHRSYLGRHDRGLSDYFKWLFGFRRWPKQANAGRWRTDTSKRPTAWSPQRRRAADVAGRVQPRPVAGSQKHRILQRQCRNCGVARSKDRLLQTGHPGHPATEQ